MREGRTSLLYMAWLIGILSAFHGVRSGTQQPSATSTPTTAMPLAPAKGPNVTVTKVSSTVLNVTWAKLGDEDSNGDITKYEVCFKLGSTISESDCTTNETVIGVNNTMVHLTGLKPATMYTVAARAFNDVGPGPLGHHKTAKTNEDAPAKGATVTKVIPISSTVLEVTWGKLQPNDTYGNITGYLVCYHTERSLVKGCTQNKVVYGVDNTTFNLTTLDEDTTYYVAVRAGTSEGFSEIRNILRNTTLEAVPARGPSLVRVVAVNSTSLMVTWNELSHDNANGIIRNYGVCYKETVSSKDICTRNKIVGNVLSTSVIGLKKYTSYDVAIKAATIIGFGKIGSVIINKRTKEDKPGKPLLTIQNTTLTKIALKWAEPKEPNGKVTKYNVCWKADGSTSGTWEIESIPPNILSHTIIHLKPGTDYLISVSAFTIVGKGDAASKTAKTVQSDFEEVQLVGSSTMGVSDDTTQIGFKLPEIKLSEAAKISSFQVIVKRWTSNEKKNALRVTPHSNITNFTNSENGKNAYIALSINGSINDVKNIIVGDDTTTTSQRKKIVHSYRNAPLNEDTRYAIFVRAFYGDITSFSTSEILVASTARRDDDKSYLFIIITTLTLLGLAVLFVIAVVLLIRRRRALKTSNTKLTHGNKGKRNARTSEVIYDQPFQMESNKDLGDYDDVATHEKVGNYDDVIRKDEGTYTALNHRNDGKQDEDHAYAHLNKTHERYITENESEM